MEKEFPLLEFGNGQTPTPGKEVIPKPDKAEKELEVHPYVNGLAKRVSRLMKQGDGYLEACKKVFNADNIGKDQRRKLMSEIGKVLGRRGGEKTKKIKAYRKKHTVPKGKTFTPDQIAVMIEGSKKLKEDEEERAGQTYKESDLE